MALWRNNCKHEAQRSETAADDMVMFVTSSKHARGIAQLRTAVFDNVYARVQIANAN